MISLMLRHLRIFAISPFDLLPPYFAAAFDDAMPFSMPLPAAFIDALIIIFFSCCLLSFRFDFLFFLSASSSLFISLFTYFFRFR